MPTLTERVAVVETIMNTTLPRHEKKLDNIQLILKNGLIDSLKDVKRGLVELRRCIERPSNDSGEPVERRAEPPPLPEPKKKFWKDWPISAKIATIVFVLLNFPIIYKWGEVVAINFVDIVTSLAGIK